MRWAACSAAARGIEKLSPPFATLPAGGRMDSDRSFNRPRGRREAAKARRQRQGDGGRKVRRRRGPSGRALGARDPLAAPLREISNLAMSSAYLRKHPGRLENPHCRGHPGPQSLRRPAGVRGPAGVRRRGRAFQGRSHRGSGWRARRDRGAGPRGIPGDMDRDRTGHDHGSGARRRGAPIARQSTRQRP